MQLVVGKVAHMWLLSSDRSESPPSSFSEVTEVTANYQLSMTFKDHKLKEVAGIWKNLESQKKTFFI